MTITQVTTETFPTIVMQLPSQSSDEEDYLSLLERLASILTRFETCEDTLSKRLFKWGAEVLETSCSDLNPEDLLNYAQRRIHELMKEILCNSLDGASLEEPVLDEDYVWDQCLLNDYQRYCNFSPFTAQPFNTKPHLFAKEMLAWTKSLQHHSLFSSIFSQQRENKIILYSSNRLNPYLSSEAIMCKLLEYQQLALNAMKVRNEQKFKEQCRKLTIQAKQSIELSCQQQKQSIERMQQNEKVRDERLIQGFKELSQTHQSEINLLLPRIEELIKQKESLDKKLEMTESKMEVQMTQINDCQAQISNLSIRLWEAQNSSMGRGSCTII